jgi:acyl-CoA reductase-like NAD-dependent aldehyde dehydrogenase
MVTGSGTVIGQGVIDHPDVSGITFTGSDLTGKKVAEGAVARGAKYQLEMGGKNPALITEDADLDLAVDGTLSGAFKSTGQKCTATSRVIIHESQYEAFKNKLLAKMKDIKIGEGMLADTWMGPCASEAQINTVLSYIDKGKKEGASLLYGGHQLTGETYYSGFYVEPTVFGHVTRDMAIVQEEIFGPVIVLIPFREIDEAIELANNVKFGLSASIYTRDIGSILAFVEDMEAGLIRINAETASVELQAPFGGMKQSSSHSREQGQAAIEFYTSIKTIFFKS